MTVDIDKLDEVIGIIEKEYGKSSIHKGSESLSVVSIPTGSLELDLATGGGIPIGMISRFYGAYGSGKTLNSLRIIKNAQNIHLIAQEFLEYDSDVIKYLGQNILERWPNGMEVAYYNIEKRFNKEFAKLQGVDTDRLHLIEQTEIEPVTTNLEALLNVVHVHVLDSVSAATSVDELAGNVEDWHRGLNARVWGKALNRINKQLDSTDNTVIFIDQVRIDQHYGNEYPPGGKKLEHAPSLTLHFKRGKKLYRKDGELQDKAPKKPNTLSGQIEGDGVEIKVHVVKSSVGAPFRSARLVLDFATVDYDHVEELSKAAIHLEVVKANGNWYETPTGENLNGKKQVREFIKDNDEFKFLIKQKAYESMIT